MLTTLNATYFHCAFGLRYLYANLKELQPRAKILEFLISQSARDIVENILAEKPKIVGVGVYIWNARQSWEVVSLLKQLAPDVLVILGGPEVSHETEGQPICRIADFTVKGEGDLRFYELCRDYLERKVRPLMASEQAPLPDLQAMASPYSFYTDEDIRHRVIYVEASRGCPYKCEFCLSALDTQVRAFPLDALLADFDRLIERGARSFKFVDRTFNLHAKTCGRILEFFLARIDRGLFLHFEMIPDRLPEEIRALLRQFPPGVLQLEIGVQTWNRDVAARISRRQDYAKVKENFAFLRRETHAHLHADLIAGLPGEDLKSFADGFDALLALEPQEIQVGILKRLKGTPIVRHDKEWEMVYQEFSPFQIVRNKTFSYTELQGITRFAKFWDLYANSGNFRETMKLLVRPGESAFWQFHRFLQFLSARHLQTHSVALVSLVESAWLYLGKTEAARSALLQDYCGRVRRDVPVFLRGEGIPARPAALPQRGPLPARQRRHLAIPTSVQ